MRLFLSSKLYLRVTVTIPSITVVRHPLSMEYNVIVDNIWCVEISPDILKVVDLTESYIWTTLLQASYSWRLIYEIQGDKDLRMSMTPGAGSE
jgi:hypothetical protein